jgi:transposase InsO family protein
MLRNRYLYGEKEKFEQLLRNETQNHGESQRNYFDSLTEALRYMLAGEGIGFDASCRVTIYRLQNNSTSYLKRIFRHSEYRAYKDEGRFRIPVSEGLVGVAWNNHGKVEFEYVKSGRAADQELQAYHRAHGGIAPTCDLSMPSRSFVIRAVEDLDSSQRIAVVVYESTKTGCLRAEAIDALLEREARPLSRLIKHLGALDGKLNPDKGGMLS